MSTLDWRLWAGMQWNIVVSVVKRSQVSAFGEIATCYFLEVSYHISKNITWVDAQKW